MTVKRKYTIFKSPDVKSAGNRFDTKNRNIATIVKNNHSTMHKEEVCGFIKGLFLGPYINSSIIIGGFMDNSMHRNFIGYMERRFRSGGLI